MALITSCEDLRLLSVCVIRNNKVFAWLLRKWRISEGMIGKLDFVCLFFVVVWKSKGISKV
jgi:hypothetical protein